MIRPLLVSVLNLCYLNSYYTTIAYFVCSCARALINPVVLIRFIDIAVCIALSMSVLLKLFDSKSIKSRFILCSILISSITAVTAENLYVSF